MNFRARGGYNLTSWLPTGWLARTSCGYRDTTTRFAGCPVLYNLAILDAGNQYFHRNLAAGWLHVTVVRVDTKKGANDVARYDGTGHVAAIITCT
jgi:hypothetical protein